MCGKQTYFNVKEPSTLISLLSGLKFDALTFQFPDFSDVIARAKSPSEPARVCGICVRQFGHLIEAYPAATLFSSRLYSMPQFPHFSVIITHHPLSL